MTKEKYSLSELLNIKNWTGLTLEQLIYAGRISPTDFPTILQFLTAEMGDVKTVKELQYRKVLAQAIGCEARFRQLENEGKERNDVREMVYLEFGVVSVDFLNISQETLDFYAALTDKICAMNE